MRVGVVFPQLEIGVDPGVIRDYAQLTESLGMDHLLAFDHVLGANAASRPDWDPPYQHTDTFHEPMVLFGFLAGQTKTLEFVTGVMILGQRQTALVAKQAAQVDVLSGGRLRLGIGTGWNDVEYEALGMNFHDRGLRSEEQVTLMRRLWTEELITYEGKWHKITDAGICPLPVQQPIPVWFGGHADIVKRRIARMGDGWFPLFRPDERGAEQIEKLRGYAREEGRDPAEIGIEAMIPHRGRSEDKIASDIAGWRDLGATHISINTMNSGMKSPQDHMDAITAFAEIAKSVLSAA